jgi:hypothetical protein
MKKTVLLVLAVVLLLSLTAVSQAQESPVITVYKDKTTKIIMAVQYTEYKDNSGDVQLIIAHDDDRDLYFDGVRAGDSFTYSINVEETGKYELRISFGWLDSTGKYTIVVDGEEVGILENTIASTGWRNWTNFDPISIELTKGEHTLTIVNGTPGPNLKYVLLTPEGKEVGDLGTSVHLYDGSASGTPWNLKDNNLSSIAIQFNATSFIKSLKLSAPNWMATPDIDYELEFKLYKWNGSFAKTVSGTSVASRVFEKYPDNTWLYMPVNVEAGEYVLVVTNNGTPNSGFYIKNKAHESQRVYFDGVVKENMAAELIIGYASTPETDYGPLSEDTPENPETGDSVAVYLLVVVATFGLAFLKKRQDA